MRPRIAIPVPHSRKPDYAQRSLPQYVSAVENAGGEAVVIQLNQDSQAIARLISSCHAVLLPGSPADVDPQKYGAQKLPQTAAADPLRDVADELLLQDAFNLRKPILGICYGLQSLNVWRTGTLVQDIPSVLHSKVNHEAGRDVARAHQVEVDPLSRLAAIVRSDAASDWKPLMLEVNSSHHQAAEVIGDGLRITARCSQDGVIEAIEGTGAAHWVLAVQWHPERTADDPASRALFRALVQAAQQKT
jgi:putative glutamine amidotransferase